jgi:hypothetical protein
MGLRYSEVLSSERPEPAGSSCRIESDLDMDQPYPWLVYGLQECILVDEHVRVTDWNELPHLASSRFWVNLQLHALDCNHFHWSYDGIGLTLS